MTTAYTYILQCANGQYYIGSTTDLDRRLQEHQAGLGAKFTRAHLPVNLVYKEEYASIEQAFARERQLHGWSRAKKEALIKGKLTSLRSLSHAVPEHVEGSKGNAPISSTGTSINSVTAQQPSQKLINEGIK